MSHETCEPFREHLSDLAEGEIEGPEKASVEGHVASCASCRADLALLSGVVRNLVKIGEEDVPRELLTRVMAQVRAPNPWERALEWILASLKIAVPVAAMVMIGIAVRPYMADPAPAADQFATVPRWWGGPLLVNEMPHPMNQSGKLFIRPGDSLRTADKVEVSLYLNDAQVEMRPKSSLIMKRDGLYLAQGQIVVRVPEGSGARGEEHAVKVATQNAIVVHIGTTFQVTFDHGVTTTEVSQGRVRLYSTTGETQELGAGQSATVNAKGLVPPPEPFIPARARPEEIRTIRESLPGGPSK